MGLQRFVKPPADGPAGKPIHLYRMIRMQAAECYEGSGQFGKAAAIYLQLGDRENALRCFRSVPDFESALRLVRQMEAHPARAPLE